MLKHPRASAPGRTAKAGLPTGGGADFFSIDDACLHNIFSFLTPLPDLFNAARACERFRGLALTRRSWLVVTHDTSAAAVTGVPQQYRQQYPTLAAAVASSRPGDTILLEPGAPHKVAATVTIPHPLHILGGGAAPGDTVLRGPYGEDAVLDFRATGRVANVTVEARLGACVAHTRGRLTVERCMLRCDARGLAHLVSPLLCRATSLSAQVQGSKFDPGAASKQVGHGKRLDPAAATVPVPALPSAGPGAVSVVESVMEGGSKAVRLCGTGCLQAVRVIYDAAAPLFWFEVDSAVPGGPLELLLGPPSDGAGAEIGDDAAGLEASLPSWARRGAAPFDPVAFQAKVESRGALAGVPAGAAAAASWHDGARHTAQDAGDERDDASAGDESSTEAALHAKAELWSAQHHQGDRSPAGSEAAGGAAECCAKRQRRV